MSGDNRRLGAFDTDASALERRIAAHDRYGTRRLDPWVMERLELTAGMRVLELGCGTGKQTLPIAESVGNTGRVLAIDASVEGLARLREEAERRGVQDRIGLANVAFDDLDAQMLGGPFDRVVSCYALYYSREPRPLLEAVEAAMAPASLLFFCGPSGANNAELKQFCAQLTENSEKWPEEPDRAIEFMEEAGVELARGLFGEVEELEFENRLRFDSTEALMDYWTSYNLYDPGLSEAFEAAAERHFERNRVFETVKRMRAVRARKR